MVFKIKKLRVGSHFSGIGSVNEAIKKFNLPCEVVYSIEYDEVTQKAYRDVYNTKNIYGDISKVNPSELPPIDIIITSPPCQAFSGEGLQKGLADDRGKILFETFRIIEHQKAKMVLLENVRNLKSIDGGKVFDLILKLFHMLDYRTKFKILNSINYNSAQTRERLFIVAFDKDEQINFKFPPKQKLTHKVKDILCHKDDLDNVRYRDEQKIKKLFPIRQGRFLKHSHQDVTVSYQYDKQILRPHISHTLLCKETCFYHIDNSFRTLTLRERFKLQSFTDETIDKFLNLKLSRQKYLRFTGNTINVNVVGSMIKKLVSSFDKFENKNFTNSAITTNVIYDFAIDYINLKMIKNYKKRDTDKNLSLEDKQKQSAYVTHQKNKNKSIELINLTTKTLQERGISVNIYQITKYSKLSKNTVKKYFNSSEISS